MCQPLRIGIVGAGSISGVDLNTLERLIAVRLTAIADLDAARAAKMIASGTSIYGEKSLAATVTDERAVIDPGRAAGVRAGGALGTVLRPVSSALGAASRTRQTRTIGSGPRTGEGIPVDVDSRVTVLLRHVSGVLSTLVMSFDSASNSEIHGDTGSLIVPDPNRFDGDVLVHELDGDWRRLEPSADYRDASRGYGIPDLATTPVGEPARANGDLSFHVLDTVMSLRSAAESGRSVAVDSSCERTVAVPLSDAPGGVRH